MDRSDIHASNFRLHISQVQAHLLGQTQQVLLPSTYWTSSEKNLFFRALARYSHLRPDLIAAHIKTKSIVDICAYIDLLHAASKDNPISRGRGDIEIAFEVSDSWVQHEEQVATSLAAAEVLWDNEQRKVSRQEQLAKKRDDLGAHEMFDDWRTEAEAQWCREDSLRCLDTFQLDVLESILRTGDPTLTSNNVNVTQDSEKVDYQVSNALQGASSNPCSAVDGAIDDPIPSLIASPLSNISAINTEQITSKPRGDGLQPASNTPVQSADSTLARQPATPRDALTPNNSLPQVAPEVLSPASRRRLQKRLYMRRKRAEQSGTEVNYTVDRLRPGREKIERPKQTKGHKQRGLTRPYRIRQQFAEQQINLTELQRTGLDLFHLSMLSRLIELYKSGYIKGEEDVVTSISADTIQLLRAIVVTFVTEVIYRAIVFRNQEFQRKGEVKVWRLGEKEISADVIQSCLEAMGFGNLTKKAYFEQLLRDQSDSDQLSMDESETEGYDEADYGNVSESEGKPELSITINEPLPQDMIPLFSAEYECDTSIMSVDTDEDSLRKELEEEEQLDQDDGVAMKYYESQLWKQEI